ncbi:MAG: glycosyltransferase family 39 protein [Verrucomicrobia bacterium]|nr:glycosyltransferase family 39 protein [Verrucomicrobiota bacterium]
MKRTAGVLIAGLIGLVLFRAVLVMAEPEKRINNTDELQMVLATADRFLGVPYVHSAWPGGPLQFAMLPVMGADMALHRQGQPVPDAVAKYLSELYRSPWRMLRAQQLMVVLWGGAGLAFFGWALFRATGRVELAAYSSLIVAAAPVFWSYWGTGVADVVSFTFAALACLVALRRGDDDWRWGWVGLWFGLAVASKLTIALMAPFLIGLYFSRDNRVSHRAGGKLVLAGAVGFFLACPYAWIEPLRFVKTVLGNAARPGVPLGWSGALGLIGTHLGWPALVLGAVGALTLWQQPRRAALIGAGLSVVLAGLVFSRAGVVYDRYVLPLILPLAFLAVHGLIKISGVVTHWRPAWRGGVLTGLAVAATLACGAGQIRAERRHFTERRERTEATLDRVLQDADAQLVAVQFSPYMLARFGGQCSREDLLRLADGVSQTPTDVMASHPGALISSRALEVLGPNFNAWEQTLAARYRAMAAYAGGRKREILFWGPPALVRRFGLLTPEQARAAVRGRKDAIFIGWGTQIAGDADEEVDQAALLVEHGGAL